MTELSPFSVFLPDLLLVKFIVLWVVHACCMGHNVFDFRVVPEEKCWKTDIMSLKRGSPICKNHVLIELFNEVLTIIYLVT